MYLTLHVHDEAAQSEGKRFKVYSHNARLSVHKDVITVAFENEEVLGTGDRGGNARVIKREVEVSLGPEDLTAIFNVALRAGLLKTVTFESGLTNPTPQS